MITSPRGSVTPDGLLSLAAAKAMSHSNAPVKREKPDGFPHKHKILVGFAVVLFFAWARAHDAWPYGEYVVPAVIFFGLPSLYKLCSTVINYVPPCVCEQEEDKSFPHKWKIMFCFGILFVLAWQQNHSGVDARI